MMALLSPKSSSKCLFPIKLDGETRQEGGIAESNGNVRNLIGSCEIAVCAHEQYKIGQKQPRTTRVTSGGLKLQFIHNCHIFLLIYISNVHLIRIFTVSRVDYMC